LLNIVADTNDLVSALLGKRLRIFFELLRQEKFILVFSEETFSELIFVLQRPKFRDHLSPVAMDEFRELLSFHSLLVHPLQKVAVCRDKKDNMFLECALHLPVDYIVTGDDDLLVLHPFQNIPIITPNTFIQTIQESSSAFR
jgi:putative PIN family toxin of toxin-antitoxin system